MNDLPFIAAAYGISAAAVVSYAAYVLRRGRRLSRQVPEDRRRWT